MEWVVEWKGCTKLPLFNNDRVNRKAPTVICLGAFFYIINKMKEKVNTECRTPNNEL